MQANLLRRVRDWECGPPSRPALGRRSSQLRANCFVAWHAAGEVLETKKLPSDINPVFNSTFSIHRLSESDVLEFTVMDYGVLSGQHLGGLGPKRIGRCILQVGGSGGSSDAWLDLTSDTQLSGPHCGNGLLSVTARFAIVQGSLPPIGQVSGIADVLMSLPGAGSSAAALPLQALQPSAPPLAEEAVLEDPEVSEEMGSRGAGACLSASAGSGISATLKVIADEEEFAERKSSGVPLVEVVGESAMAKQEQSAVPVGANKSSVFYIDEAVFTWEPLATQCVKMAEISKSPTKYPFPQDLL